MLKRQLNYSKKLAEDIRYIPFASFGIIANDDFDMKDIVKYIRIFDNCLEVESELNKLTTLILKKFFILIFIRLTNTNIIKDVFKIDNTERPSRVLILCGKVIL